jgi:hypothetical protein
MQRVDINYAKYPILEKLVNGKLGKMPVYEDDIPFFNIFGNAFTSQWKTYCKKYLNEVNILSIPFIQAAEKAEERLIELWKDFTVNDSADFDVSGTYIYGDIVYMIDYHILKGVDFHELSFFAFTKEGTPMCMLTDSDKYKIYENGWVSSSQGLKNNHDAIRSFIYSKIGLIVVLKMFQAYADVETKTIFSNGKVKDINCVYYNETKIKINHLTSKWFTNIVKSDGFGVRGHFRLQPKKENGKWTRELIWINDFRKNGYNSPALKLKTQTV